MTNINNIHFEVKGNKVVVYNSSIEDKISHYLSGLGNINSILVERISKVIREFIKEGDEVSIPQWLIDESNYRDDKDICFAYFYHGDGEYNIIVKGTSETNFDYYNPSVTEEYEYDNHTHTDYYNNLSELLESHQYIPFKWCDFITVSKEDNKKIEIKHQIKNITKEMLNYLDFDINGVWDCIDKINKLKEEYEKLK